MAGLFDSMNIAASGLTSQATAMTNISNDIANAQTVGYKADDTSFADLVNQSGAYAAGSGGGVTAITTSDVSLQGTLAAATSPTNLAISGNGFFAVQSGQVTSTGSVGFGGNTEYTRDGDFELNAQNYLVNGSGNYLEGYAVDAASGDVNTSALVPIQISQASDPPVATSAVTLEANLPSNATATTTLSPTTIQVYDASGNSHSLTIDWTNTGAGQWTAEVQAPDAVGGFDNSLDLSFGNTAAQATGTVQSIANASGSTAFTVPSGAAAAAGQPATASFSVNFGSGPQTVTLDLGTFNQSGGLTQFASSDDDVDVTSATQNGLPVGSYEGVSIDTSGNVKINYSNGQSTTAYQIPIVQFNAPDQLQAGTGDVYTQTAASGTPMISAAQADGAGTIESSELEDSNVDLTGEFTKMIQTQQIYSADSRAITTANDMLADLLNIIHS